MKRFNHFTMHAYMLAALLSFACYRGHQIPVLPILFLACAWVCARAK